MKSVLIVSLLLVALVSATSDSQLRGSDRKLGDVGDLGSILNVNIKLSIPPLLSTIAVVDISNAASVAACIGALNILKVDLNALLLGVTPGVVAVIDAKATIADLVAIIVAVNLDDPASICHCVNACDLLCGLLTSHLATLPHRALNGLLNINLNLEVLCLVDAIVHVDVKNAVSVKAAIDALGLLKLKLNVQILVLQLLGCTPGSLINIVGATIVDLTNIIAVLDINDITSCLNVLNCITPLTGCYNDILTTLPHRNLNGLVGLNLTAEVLSLIHAIITVNVKDKLSVRVTIALLNLLCVDLKLLLPAGCTATGATVSANATIADLLLIIQNCNPADATSCVHCIDACNALIVLLKVLL